MFTPILFLMKRRTKLIKQNTINLKTNICRALYKLLKVKHILIVYNFATTAVKMNKMLLYLIRSLIVDIKLLI